MPEGGYVYGCAWSEDWSPIHIEISNEKSLDKLRRSKYVQSNTLLTYSQAKARLKEGKWVLYTGTPCQIAGLNAVLGKTQREKLVTLDLVCHGVPSIKVFKKFIHDNQIPYEKLTDIKFRDKRYSWFSSLSFDYADGTVKHFGVDNIFMQGFNPCLLQRRSCSSCPYAKLPRQGDLSCGDFWGVHRFHPEFDRKGTSFLLVNTEQGHKLFDLVKDDFAIAQKEKIENPIFVNKTIIHPFNNHPGRKHFYSALELKPFNKLIPNSLKHHYDVGIHGLWYGINYGSVLTYFALYTLIRKLGYDAVFLPRPNNLWSDQAGTFDSPHSLAMKFIWDHCNVFISTRSQGEFEFFNNNCDTFVLGSDVVWNYNVCGKSNGYNMFFDFVHSNKKKIAYASSIGEAYFAPEFYKPFAKQMLNRFDAISLREDSGVKFITELTGRKDVVQVLDPVFVIDKEEYCKLYADTMSAPSKYIFSYIIRAEEHVFKKNVLRAIQKATGLPIVLCPNPHEPLKAPITKYFNEFDIQELSVEDWLNHIANASFFIGDSYHGLCFSLIFHVPFVIFFEKSNSTIARIKSLLHLVGLEDRLFTNDMSLDGLLDIVNTTIDWDHVDEVLKSEREKSMQWLKNKLSAHKPDVDPEISLLEKKMFEQFSVMNSRLRDLHRALPTTVTADNLFSKNELKAIRRFTKIHQSFKRFMNAIRFRK